MESFTEGPTLARILDSLETARLSFGSSGRKVADFYASCMDSGYAAGTRDPELHRHWRETTIFNRDRRRIAVLLD